MLTPLGKEIRKIRIDHLEGLGDLASSLEVSSAYLSAIETGKKNAPKELVEKIADHYKIFGEKRDYLHELAHRSKVSIKVGLSSTTDLHRELAVSFARKFDSCDEETSKRILELLNKGGNKK